MSFSFAESAGRRLETSSICSGNSEVKSYGFTGYLTESNANLVGFVEECYQEFRSNGAHHSAVCSTSSSSNSSRFLIDPFTQVLHEIRRAAAAALPKRSRIYPLFDCAIS